MNNEGGIGITAAILLVTFMLIAVTAASVVMDTSPKNNRDLKKIADEAVNKISTYIQIEDTVGKYYNIKAIIPDERKRIIVVEATEVVGKEK